MAQFMDLPAEVRVQIYRLLVCEQVCRRHISKRTAFALRDCNIHQVSRQIQQEVLPLLYSENDFRLVGTLDLRWLNTIGQANRDSLHRVTILFNSRLRAYSRENGQPRILFSLLAQCPNITLTIRTTLHDLWRLDGAACEAFANMHGFLEATAEVLNFSIAECFCRDHTTAGIREGESDLAQIIIGRLITAGLESMTGSCSMACLIHQGVYRRQSRATVHFKWGYIAQFRGQCVVCDFQHFRLRYHRTKHASSAKSIFITRKL